MGCFGLFAVYSPIIFGLNMLKTIVKISDVTNLSDARYCAGMGVEMLGFSVDETSGSFVDLKKFQEIRSWIAGVQIVAETTSTDAEVIVEKITSYQPDAVQVSEASVLPWLKAETIKPIILRVEADQDVDTVVEIMENNLQYASYFLLESSSESALDGDWPEFLGTIASRFPILIGFGITPENASSLSETTAITGVALRGSEEIRPGFKDFGELMDVLEALEDE